MLNKIAGVGKTPKKKQITISMNNFKIRKRLLKTLKKLSCRPFSSFDFQSTSKDMKVKIGCFVPDLARILPRCSNSVYLK